MSLSRLESRVNRLTGRADQLRTSLTGFEHGLSRSRTKAENVAAAGDIVRAVAQATQKELEYQFSQVVSIALNSIFDDPYKLVVEFVVKRNRTEAELWFERNGERVKPLDATGGGVVDVAAFALRVALWNISKPHSRSVLVLDEPLRNLSRNFMFDAGIMIKEISEKLGMQFIIVTHIDELVETADTIFRIDNKKGISKIGVE